MLIEIKLKELTNGAKEAKVIRVHKKTGEEVAAGEILFDLEANKAAIPLKSECSGRICSIAVEVPGTVSFGDVLAVIEGDGTGQNTGQKTAGNFDYFGSLLKQQEQQLTCDIAILGGGPGGYVAAIQAAQLGARVVLVEKDAVGGTCLNRGCIPTKAMVRSAEVFNHLKKAEEFGCHAENVNIDLKKVIERKDGIVNQLVQGIHYLLNKHNIRLVSGLGELVDQETISVKSRMEKTIIKAKSIIIATGSQPAELPVDGAEIDNIVDSEQILRLKHLPERMVVVGGGVIGMEFAFIFANFGAQVSVIEYCNDCLAMLDQDICEEITRKAKEKGIKIYTDAKVNEFVKSENDQCIVSIIQKDKSKYLLADKVLMCVGRKPSMDGIDAEKLGLELNESQRGIKVNAQMQTNIPNVYAIGDVTGKIMLAHVASHQGMVAAKNIMGQDCEMDYTVVPSAIFTDPEIAVVGLTKKEAEKMGTKIEVGKFPFAANGKALTLGEGQGFVKIISEKTTGKVLGGAIIGSHATDLIAEITTAVKNKLTTTQIAENIYAHPTTSEVIHEAALILAGGAMHFVE